MISASTFKNANVKIYHGYGHTHNLIVFGHVFRSRMVNRNNYSDNIIRNITHLVRLFLVKPLGGVTVQLEWRNQFFISVTEADGFFGFEWKSDTSVEAGWHDLLVRYLLPDGKVMATGTGKVYVPHSTQYAFISDIDDTILISHSVKVRKKLGLLFTKNPHTRKTFEEVAEHYRLLGEAHTVTGIPNPFFYVSNSEWNLYDDLVDFFRHNRLPEGSFLLNHLKTFLQLFKTGESQTDAKLRRAARIIETFPKQRFILLGDNSQQDPDIYALIVSKYPDRIFAVYIRNISSKNESHTVDILEGVKASGIFTCFYTTNTEAIRYGREIGLIQ